MRSTLSLFASLGLVAACGHIRPSPVAIHGERAAIASLAGRWRGDYEGLDSGRGGNMTFLLRAGSDSAVGDVLMEPRGTPVLFRAVDNGPRHLAHASSAQLLGISFVGVSFDEVSGALEPYVAPDCSCTVTTTFRGRVVADTIEGTYTTTAPMLTAQTGKWRMVRESP